MPCEEYPLQGFLCFVFSPIGENWLVLYILCFCYVCYGSVIARVYRVFFVMVFVMVCYGSVVARVYDKRNRFYLFGEINLHEY